MAVVLPGEQVPAKHVNLKLGPGLLQQSNYTGESSETTVISTKAGVLNHSTNRSKWWVEGNSRRYVPAPQESVIGVVTQRLGEGYRVDIGSAHQASLDALAFEGATKRNKPNLKVGSLIYARVSLAHKDMEPELECFDAQTRKAEGFGELKGGFMIKCSLKLCRDLLDPRHFLFPLLGARFPLESAIGMNGRVWISTKDVKHTIAIARCIEAVDPDGEGKDANDIKAFLQTLDL
ncbi:exosome complex exonuclease RRP40 [Coprinopsis cinerea okayama7|uniref:Ribosomal RNA-processing protein 40 n=1 Tax=Coprinopsis cinerea (strain Okayama-7 / 130 / ATCC MYA-4618 / FGSC 9003) TaxID=240176 RepID=D6RP13_COPC7|nr:exosome complex exonuclease RRP40 [Coprinopsis cinerea okayama7\|eukprot:XP_002910658.1 exosome complex exonuclease RRP40 [Coprinopsis cinerea okayama7\